MTLKAPPTPPPTSAVELQDQARSIAHEESTSAQLASEAETRSDIYQSALPAIVETIQRNDYAGLVKVTERVDFTTTGDSQPSRLFIVAPLVLGHLVLDDTPAARHALSRLPDNLIALPFSQGLTSLVVATINREHAKVYNEASNLLSFVGHPDFLDLELASIITSLLTAFIEDFRVRTFDLISKAYTSLPLRLTSVYLGWPEDMVITVAESHGWSYDPSTQVFSPRSTLPKVAVTSSYFTLGTFHLVTDSVAKLEV